MWMEMVIKGVTPVDDWANLVDINLSQLVSSEYDNICPK